MTDNLTDGTSIGEDHPMDFLLSEDFDFGFPRAGEIREGQVIAHRNNEALVDIGAKSEGIIPASEIETMDAEEKSKIAVGNLVSVYVVDPDDQDGNILLSYRKALEEDDWELAQQLFDSQETYSGKVVGFNRGGLLIKVGMVRGFVPSSQLSNDRRMKNQNSTSDNWLSQFVGDAITTRVIEVDRSRNRLIMSERAAMREIRAARRSELMREMEEGDVREGRVVNLADFGAFVDIGGIEGLVHLSELSWKRINHPSELLEVGQEVQVYVLNIDKERGRVALSLKRLEPDPWTTIDERYQEGSLVEVTITKLTKYGAFARLNDDYELEGLIHISEMSDDRIEHPQEVVRKGEKVAVRIIKIDTDQRQMGLSMKQVASEEYFESDLAMAEGFENEA